MNINIEHKTSYLFSEPVFLEPHVFRLYPQSSPHITVESFDVHVTPTPAGISAYRDTDNNIVQMCWFNGAHKELTVTSKAGVALKSFDPFDFLISPISCASLPMTYPDSMRESLSTSLKTISISPDLLDWGKRIVEESNGNTIPFLHALCSNIHDNFQLEFREFGEPLDPDETFAQKRGSCRDLAWLQIQLLRHLGLAARFVSGYLYIDAIKPEWELHGWCEVYLPGAGWRGLDPSHGLFAGDGYIPLSANANPGETMPVTGTFRGSATCDLTTELTLEAL